MKVPVPHFVPVIVEVPERRHLKPKVTIVGGGIGPLIAGNKVSVDEIRPPQEAQIIHIITRIDGSNCGVEEELPFLFVEHDATGKPAHRRCGTVKPEVYGVGPLEIMNRILLQCRHSGSRSRDPGH